MDLGPFARLAGGAAAAAAGVCGCCVWKLRSGGVWRPAPQGPLAGVVVIDLSTVIAAPWGAMQLGELGAEVIKVENMKVPDVARGLGTAPSRGMGGCAAVTAHGKQSIVLDMKKEAGRAAFLELVKRADIVLHNFRPGAMERLQIDYEACRTANPDIIFIASSGFGQTGPRSELRIYDPIVQVLSGVAGWQGDAGTEGTAGCGHHGGVSQILAQAPFDKTTAQTVAQAAVAALYARNNGAGGQQIDVRMIDAALHWCWSDVYAERLWDKPQTPQGAVDDLFPLAEWSGEGGGRWVVGSGPGEGTPLCTTTPFVGDHVRPADPARHGLVDMRAQPRVAAPFRSHTHLLFGSYSIPRHPTRFGGTPLAPRPACPMLGEHTNKVLREAGFAPAEVDALLRDGAAISTRSFLLKDPATAPKAKVFGLIESLQALGGSRKGAMEVKEQSVAKSPRSKAIFANGPLSMLRVVDASTMVAGPFAASILADQGARCVKVEQTGSPDPSRGYGPGPPSMGAMFMALNRGKLSLSVEPGQEEEVALRAAAWADVIICDEGSVLGVPMMKLRRGNPNVIIVNIQKGPGESACQALAGHQYEQRRDDPGRPAHVRGMLVEKLTGWYASLAATAAVFARDRTHRGQVCDVDMLTAATHWAMADLHWGAVWAPKARTAPPRFPSLAHLYRIKPTKDKRYVFALVVSDREMVDFMRVFEADLEGAVGVDGVPLLDKWRGGKWKTLAQRIGDFDNIWECCGHVFSRYTLKELEPKCKEAELAFAPVLSLEEAIAEPQVAHNKALERLSAVVPWALAAGAPGGGGAAEARLTHTVARPGAVFCATPGRVRGAASALGHDTAEARRMLDAAGHTLAPTTPTTTLT